MNQPSKKPWWKREPSKTQIKRWERGLDLDPDDPDYWEPRTYKCKTYFILNRTTGYVKIGRTTGIQTRFKTLRTACGDTLELLLLIPYDIERQLHEHFSYQRVWPNAEWFKYDDEIREWVRTSKLWQKNTRQKNGIVKASPGYPTDT